MFAEFEEKEFESYFNLHLKPIMPSFWCPGQVLEGAIGFDGAAMIDLGHIGYILGRINHSRYWHLRRGVRLDSGWVKDIFDVLDHAMPPYKFNFFAQYKRPERLTRSNADQWGSWRGPYYRYKVEGNQNRLLCKLESICGSGAVVSYCCPAFHTKKELWDANNVGQILHRTNYAPPSRLENHHTYSFVAPGARGKGHSEEEEIVGKTLEEMIALGNEANKPQPASGLVRMAGKAIHQAFAELGDSAKFAREMAAQLLVDVDRGSEGFSLADAVAHVVSLRFAFGTSVMLMGGDDKR